jgi:SAM-dependent methyltransferase
LDVACADGKFRNFVPSKHYVGVDGSLEAISQARERYPDVKFVCADITSNNIHGLGKFDYVICTHTIAHIEDDKQEQVLIWLKSLLANPSGALILQLQKQDYARHLEFFLKNFNIVGTYWYRGFISDFFEVRPAVSKGREYLSYLFWMSSFIEGGKKDVLLVLKP